MKLEATAKNPAPDWAMEVVPDDPLLAVGAGGVVVVWEDEEPAVADDEAAVLVDWRYSSEASVEVVL